MHSWMFLNSDFSRITTFDLFNHSPLSATCVICMCLFLRKPRTFMFLNLIYLHNFSGWRIDRIHWQTWLKPSCFANEDLEAIKLISLAPGYSHTKSKLSRLYWFPPSPLGLKDPEVENGANPIGCRGITKQPLHTPCQHLAQRFLNSAAQHSTQDFSVSICLHLCYPWRLRDEYKGTPDLQKLLIWWESKRVKGVLKVC